MATAVAAVLGIAVSVALAWAASQLTGQRVGLSAEPLSVATGLSPRPASASAHAPARRSDDQQGSRQTTTSARPPAATSATATTSPPPSRTITVAPALSTPPVQTTTSTAATTASSGGSFAPASARHSGRHGDGGDQHDD